MLEKLFNKLRSKISSAGRQKIAMTNGFACSFLQLILTLALAMTMLLPLVGCDLTTSNDNQNSVANSNYNNGDDTENTTLKIVTTNFVLYDFARVIGGDAISVQMLLKPGAELHSYEPTPQDIIAIQECDVFLYIGGESDTWVNDILGSMDTSKIMLLRMMDSVSTLGEVIVEGMQTENEESDAENSDLEDSVNQASEGQVSDDQAAELQSDEPELDEHIWTSPKNAITMVNAISSALMAADQNNSALFENNAQTYISELTKLDESFQDVVASAKRTTLVFGDRFPFLYLTHELGLSYYAAFPGCSTETDASPATIAFLIEKTKAEQIPVILKVEMSSSQIADLISEGSGAKVLTLHSVHNVSANEFTSGASYLSLMKENVKVLREALQ
ncbi:MAG: metal ABC transporter substrate-binding protein [Coriobacteriales bacterium]|nr:metal ABC transporter substrate-binding protein [Coriobacteriales bacterium]